MRLNYRDEEEFSGQFALWRANCERSMRGVRGQVSLKRLEAALVALPQKRLIHGAMNEVDEKTGSLEVCALGAVAMMEGQEKVLYSDDDPEEAGVEMGFPRLVAWTVVAENDIEYGRRVTPEDRYVAMLAWVRSQILPATT
jgi:hypothetical protein